MTREEERWTPPVPGGGAPRRRSVGRGVAAAALAAALAAGALRAGCARRGVSLSDLSVSERDVEVARQMGAPEEALGAMEGGGWPSAGSRFMVRYAEMAQDHMLSRYGQPCRAEAARTPWMLEPRATVGLVAEGGEHDGEAVTVTIDTSASPWAYADTWHWTELHEAYEREVLAAVSGALAALPEGSWAAEAGMYKDSADWYRSGQTLHDASNHSNGWLKVALSSSCLSDAEELFELIGSAIEELGLGCVYHVVVFDDGESGVPMTPERAEELRDAAASDTSIVLWDESAVYNKDSH